VEDPKFVEVNGIRTSYFEGGSGEPLVLVSGGHFGFNCGGYDFYLNFDGLCQHFHVYALDKLGQGFTDNPKTDADYTMSAVIEHIYGFLRALDIKGATLAGHSRGALPVTRIAIDHPEMVSNLVIFASATLGADEPCDRLGFYAKLEDGAPAIPDMDYVRREPEANSFSRHHITDEFLARRLKISLLPKMAEAKEKMTRLSETHFKPDLRKRRNETLDLVQARHLKVPTIMIWGANDPSAPLKLGVDLFQVISSVVPRSQLHVFNQAGHYSFMEHAWETNQLLVNFCLGKESVSAPW